MIANVLISKKMRRTYAPASQKKRKRRPPPPRPPPSTDTPNTLVIEIGTEPIAREYIIYGDDRLEYLANEELHAFLRNEFKV
jgi:hypothetical protein